MKATVGGKAPSKLGLDALLDFRMEVTLDGETLSAAEIKQLLAQTDGLALHPRQVGRGRSRAAAAARSTQFEAVERRAAAEGLSFGEAMRLLAGAGIAEEADGRRPTRLERDRRRSVARRDAGGAAPSRRTLRADPGRSLQRHAAALSAGRRAMAASAGAARARRLPRRRHGPRQDHPGPVAAAGAEERGGGSAKPSLLVVPASLLANWAAEIARFAPGPEGRRGPSRRRCRRRH